MTDLFTSMRHTDNRVDVDPSFHAELLTAVRERLADAAPGTDDWIDAPLVLVDSDDEQLVGQQRRPAWPLVAAAVVVVIGLIGIALATTNDDDQSPAPVATVSVAPTTTVATADRSLCRRKRERHPRDRHHAAGLANDRQGDREAKLAYGPPGFSTAFPTSTATGATGRCSIPRLARPLMTS